MTENSVFGYGSLISRTSFSARFTEELVEEGIVGTEELVEMNVLRDEDELDKYVGMLEEKGVDPEEAEETATKMLLEGTIRTETNSNYDQGQFGYDEVGRERSEVLWRELEQQQDILPVPVEIPGERGYWLNSIRGGTMVTADPSDEEKMNGVVYIGVTEDQQDAIQADEGDEYRTLEMEWEDVGLYAPERTKQLLEERGIEEPDEIKIFYGDNTADFVQKTTARTRNERYQEAIEDAIQNQMSELYGEDVAEEFLNDYRQHTKENPVSGAPNMFQDEIDRLEAEGREEEAQEYRDRQDRAVKQFANNLDQQERSIQGFQTLIEEIDQDYQQARN